MREVRIGGMVGKRLSLGGRIMKGISFCRFRDDECVD